STILPSIITDVSRILYFPVAGVIFLPVNRNRKLAISSFLLRDTAKPIVANTRLIRKRIKEEIERYIIELGGEGRLTEMQLKEILGNTLSETRQILQDYVKENYEKVCLELEVISTEKLLEAEGIMRILGYGTKPENLDLSVLPKGYRILSKVPHLPASVVENVVAALGDLPNIMNSTVLELTEINEVGERRAGSVRRELERLKNRALLGKRF
ncbi:unnamed protein product, partial [marine sediment metagenome]